MAEKLVKFREVMNFVEFVDEFLESSSDDTEDDEYIDLLSTGIFNRHKIARVENYIERVVRQLENTQFKNHFRLSRTTCQHIIEQFGNSRFYPKANHGGSTPITGECHILSFLWFAGNKCCIRDVSDRFNMSYSTFMEVQERVMSYLIDISPSIVTFPQTDQEKLIVVQKFAEISGFPNVLGCVDGTYINIRTPAHKIKSTYTNRHDIPSITLQGICDADRKFLDAFTGPPGKIHDSRIFSMSFINNSIIPLTNNGHYHLLGDSAYAIREWLLTPYRDYGNLSQEQRKFNKKFSQTRVRIENTFGLLKGRFRQLQHLEFHKLLKISQFIISCCVLHNICIDNKDFWEEIIVNDVNEEENAIPEQQNNLRRLGEAKLDYICHLIT